MTSEELGRATGFWATEAEFETVRQAYRKEGVAKPEFFRQFVEQDMPRKLYDDRTQQIRHLVSQIEDQQLVFMQERRQLLNRIADLEERCQALEGGNG